MKASISLDEVLKNYLEYQDFIKSVDDVRDFFYDVLMDYSQEENINIVSHLADADGFGSQIIMHKGLERILEFLGNTTKKVQSKRIMNFSSDVNSFDNLKNVKQELGEGKYIILDLASLKLEDAKDQIKDLVFIDHHPFNQEDLGFRVINPHLQGIDGGKELSASMIATILINRLYEKVEADFLGDKDVRVYLNKLRRDLDYLSIFGIAGSKADMQEDVGLNRAMYDFLEKREVIERADCSFFGYSTKDTCKLFAQSNPMFNFRFLVPDEKTLNKYIVNLAKNSSNKRESLIKNIYDKFRWAFTIEEDKFGVNLFYLNSLPNVKILELNNYFTELVGHNLVEISSNEEQIRSLEVLSPFTKSNYESYEDDILDMRQRIILANNQIFLRGYVPEEVPLSKQRGLVKILKSMFRDSLIAFDDRSDLEFSLSQLDKGQYISCLDKDLAKDSIAEIANMMTAMSKLKCGDIFISAIDDVLEQKISPNIAQVYTMHKKYKQFIYDSMGRLQYHLFSKDGLVSINEDTHFMMLDFLEGLCDEIDLRTVNGVVSGIASNTKLLPKGKGIFFSGVSFEAEYRGEVQDLIKISGRATTVPKYEHIKINKFMEYFGGGGHGAAAACVIPKDKLDEFLRAINRFDFYRGEFK